MWKTAFVACVLASLGFVQAAPAAEAQGLPAIREVAKPADTVAERRPRTQPTVPENYRELPFVETAAEPSLTSEEKARGYMLFQREIMDPVYSNSNPLAGERLEGLAAFATPGEFEPLTFSIYPVRDLANLKVRASALAGPGGATIPAAELKVRLLTYWSIGYPSYTSRSTYRRLPELLENVTVASTPARECQRYWITAHVPEHTAAGLYRGTVTVWDDGYGKAVEIPVALRVLPFALTRDPDKHYSAYYYVRNSSQYRGKDDAFFEKASANEYQAMMDYGLDMAPTFSFTLQNGRLALGNAEELDRMLALGMTGPVPVTADSVIARIYTDTTPGGERGSHWHISKMPGKPFYDKVTELFKAFEADRKAKGWPEVVCCPIDEVEPASAEFGCGVYKAVRDAGLRTYATKNPIAADADVYAPYIDVWCSQPYSMPYERIVSQDRYEYWSYPNHNAGEIKDRVVMCKGGRMTWGYGLWRSGYTTLIPWHWAWTTSNDQFDYLRGRQSGCGNRIDDDGSTIPAVYWECFREGRDDERYIYSLEQAAWEREGSQDAGCQKAVADAKALLQDTWNAINVQQKYLTDGMWASSEFDARRWKMAQATEALLKYQAVRKGSAPSVTVGDTSVKASAGDDAFAQAVASGQADVLDLGGDWKAWQRGGLEATVEPTTDAGRDGKLGLRWKVAVDWELDGEGGGQYLQGWPHAQRDFAGGTLDMSDYDYLEFLVRVDSDRDEVADDSTPLGVVLTSHASKERLLTTTVDLGDRQRQWIPVRFKVADLIQNARLGADPWKDVAAVQLWVSESDFRDKTHLQFDVGAARLIRFKAPVVSRIDAPRIVTLPQSRLAVPFELLGARSVTSGAWKVDATMADISGTVRAEATQDLADGSTVVVDTKGIPSGRYKLTVKISATKGDASGQSSCDVECLDGPLM